MKKIESPEYTTRNEQLVDLLTASKKKVVISVDSLTVNLAQQVLVIKPLIQHRNEKDELVPLPMGNIPLIVLELSELDKKQIKGVEDLLSTSASKLLDNLTANKIFSLESKADYIKTQ